MGGDIVMQSIDLASLLSPTSVQSFLETVWSRRAFLARSERRDRFAGLLDLPEFEFLLSSVATPGWISFVKDVVRAPSREELTRDGTLDVAAIYRAVADGQSLLLTRVHRLHRRTGLLCRQVAADFRSAGVVLRKPIRANAYFTPPRAQGFAPHYDDHDVLVLQLHGDKLWRIHGEAVKWPRKPMVDALAADALNPKAQEVILRAGDVFYLPRGFVHEAIAQDASSLHLTLSVQAATWSDVFERLIDIEYRLGEPLPIGFCAGGASRAPDKARMAQIIDDMARSTVLDRAMADIYNSAFIEGDPPAAGLLEHENASEKVESNSWLSLANGIFADVEVIGDTAVLRLPGAALRADARALPFFRSLCKKERKAFRLCDLVDPGEALELIDLAKELVRRGVLIVHSG